MPKVIKYSTTTPSGSLRKGNMVIGPGNFDYGSTFYTTVEPPAGGYVIYQNKASGGPSIYIASNDASLISFTKHISGTTYATAAACLDYFTTQTDKIVIASSDNIPVSVTSTCILNLNAGMVASYPTTGSTWYDLSGNGNDFTLYNGVGFSPSNGGYLTFDGTNDYAASINNINLSTYDYIAVEVVYKTNTLTLGMVFEHTANWNSNGGGFGLATNVDGNNSLANCNHTNHNTEGARNYFVTNNLLWNDALNLFSKISDPTGRLTYVNGGLVSFTTTGGYSTSTATNAGGGFANAIMYLGSRGGSATFFNGNISSIKIYGFKINSSQTLQNYYQSPIVTDGLVLALDAGNLVSYASGSTTTYSMTGSISGSLVNGVGYNSGNGGNWVFDGIDDYVNISNNSSINPTTAITVASFFNISSYGANYAPIIFKQNNYTGQYEQYSLGFFNNNIFLVITGADRTQKIVQTSGNYTNQTVYAVGTCDTVTDEMKLYINGTLIQTTTFTSTFDIANTPVTIGGTGTVGYAGWTNGKIYTAQIYNRSLSALEVLQNFNAQRNRFGL